MTHGDENAIRILIEDRSKALRTGNVDGILAPLSFDIVSYDLQPPLEIAGPAASDEDGLSQWLATWDGAVTNDMRQPVVRIAGDLAFAYGLSRMHGNKNGSGPVELWYRTTLCLQRENGSWKIVHEHNSVPMAMDGSGRALVDLKPDHASRN